MNCLKPSVILTILAGLALAACSSEPVKTDPASIAPPDAKVLEDEVFTSDFCSEPVYCGEIGFVDCGSAMDGPAFFFEKESKKTISTCGGACMVPEGPQVEMCRTQCPPPEWTACVEKGSE